MDGMDDTIQLARTFAGPVVFVSSYPWKDNYSEHGKVRACQIETDRRLRNVIVALPRPHNIYFVDRFEIERMYTEASGDYDIHKRPSCVRVVALYVLAAIHNSRVPEVFKYNM